MNNHDRTSLNSKVILREVFSEQELFEIAFCQIYVNQFGHGTDGHKAKMVIAKFQTMFELLCAHQPEAALAVIEAYNQLPKGAN
jgi:hypothetical protein